MCDYKGMKHGDLEEATRPKRHAGFYTSNRAGFPMIQTMIQAKKTISEMSEKTLKTNTAKPLSSVRSQSVAPMR